ncbi:ABC transporter ATP-binding protein [Roseicyclus sp.]|uniref:ABC transporter ATP-binding protein n=1 Tax=Roseicyclus sp. TaxID=1914329 RepID=UPI003FA0CF2B
MSLLAVRDLSRSFDTRGGAVHAVRNVSLEVARGECLAVVGESGSGKTTLANMILGILAPSAGSIHFDGAELPARRTPAQRRAIQLVQQNPLSALNPKRSIGASVRLGLDTYGIGAPAERWARVEAALAEVGLEPAMRHRAPSALSGGQRQRVGIARALACEPALVVLDEPTSALDVLVQARVLRLLNDLRARRGLTYIFITHDLAVVRNVADRVAVFRAGELVELGETARIFAAPAHPYTRSLIGAVPVVDDDELALRTRLSEGT